MGTLNVKTDSKEYEIIIKRGILEEAGKYIPSHNKILIVTDENIPSEYTNAVRDALPSSALIIVPAGEQSKSLKTFEELLSIMLDNGFTRKDGVIAIGGGVIGDLSAFTASCYMRGISFYNLPTSLLSQVDSSVGGKTAVNLNGIKNIVGTFYQPDKVLIDPNTLRTLPEREYASGMAEVIKMAACLDKDFFEYLEGADFKENIEEIITRAIENKIKIVAQDEKESGLRKVLNFGHTIGHGIEVTTGLNHGESIALGMLPMCSGDVQSRIKKLMEKAKLPLYADINAHDAATAASHDKKAAGDSISIVKTDEIGTFHFENVTALELENMIKEVF